MELRTFGKFDAELDALVGQPGFDEYETSTPVDAVQCGVTRCEGSAGSICANMAGVS